LGRTGRRALLIATTKRHAKTPGHGPGFLLVSRALTRWAWDRALWYVKGGYANVGLETTAADPIPHTATDRRRHKGWTVGTGLDYMVTQNWIIGVEYDYIRLNAATHSQFPVGGIAPAAPTFYSTSITGDLHQIVARLSYKFDWARTGRRTLLIATTGRHAKTPGLRPGFSLVRAVARLDRFARTTLVHATAPSRGLIPFTVRTP
jgi:hypothetical protein